MLSDRERREKRDVEIRKSRGSIGENWNTKLAEFRPKVPVQEVDTSTMILIYFLRVVFLPIWILYKIWQGDSRHRYLKKIVIEFEKHGRGDDARGMALACAKANPHEYPLGELDPGLAKLEATFQEIVNQRKK